MDSDPNAEHVSLAQTETIITELCNRLPRLVMVFERPPENHSENAGEFHLVSPAKGDPVVIRGLLEQGIDFMKEVRMYRGPEELE